MVMDGQIESDKLSVHEKYLNILHFISGWAAGLVEKQHEEGKADDGGGEKRLLRSCCEPGHRSIWRWNVPSKGKVAKQIADILYY